MTDKTVTTRSRRRVPGHGSLVQKIRLVSGLILFVFALTHFLNHALGIFSFDALDAMQAVRRGFWRSTIGSILLYGAFATHIAMALWKIAARRTLRMPVWEAGQLLLGLAIPWFLVRHILATKGMNVVYGIDDTYHHELSILWPGNVLPQTALMFMVWIHGCIGIHYWLRIRTWYASAFPWLIGVAVVVPLMGTWGWIDAARRLWLVELDDGGLTREQNDILIGWINISLVVIVVIVVALIFYVGARILAGRLGSRVRISYPGGRVVRAAPGPTLLEISRQSGIPHASVCGGRARCSTCRTAILKGLDDLPPPDSAEKAVLERIRAEPNIRLACQIRPTTDLEVHPLMPVREVNQQPGMVADAYHWGVEQPVAVLFTDIRGFTSLSEKRLSYDVVYVLNRYLDAMSRAIQEAGGYLDKFIGDGIMAIFGIEDGVRIGCRQALDATVMMGTALDALNKELARQLEAPLRMGVGIHAGQAILGRIGAAGGNDSGGRITALGDTVNTASRLESATKEYEAVLIASRQVVRAAGLESENREITEILVRGRQTPIRVCTFPEFADVEQALAEADAPVSGRSPGS
jgi:adenylate cyclase